jgi:metal-dependent amidase/aminoacylase/carboxypeptidase family protein
MPPPVDALDSELLGELTAFRRDLHAHPELGFQENRTAARVAEALSPRLTGDVVRLARQQLSTDAGPGG